MLEQVTSREPEIALIGISYKTAAVEIREKISVRPEEILEQLRRLAAWGCQEAVALSTCNRVEFYWSGSPQEIADKVRREWEQKTGRVLDGQVYVHHGLDAAIHLFRVAAGLDSMVLGESQILGQIKTAYQISLQNGFTRRAFNRLFQTAFAAGKQVRNQTQIAAGISSVASAAVVLAEKVFSDLSLCRVMVLGAGKMAEAAAKHLASKKVKAIFVSNRTYERARDLAASLGAEALHWEEGMSRMADADIVLCSTSCPHFVLTPARIREMMRRRSGKPVFLIDIAVPRDVDPEVGKIEQVFLYDIDDLKHIVEEFAKSKKREAKKAEQIVQIRALELWRANQGLGKAPLPASRPAGALLAWPQGA
ncbi:MAG: glutamyl-tRNA reductase [Elusimicrobia bacterium RIFCSPLOWO2_12_FULL_59_9]|nr:MAG: glutamyl-tRNA reductase [Elusimicrobia bacterium RIFCSPLOWO2_12_FULL_59_9]